MGNLQGKYKIDVATNARAMLRTTEACQNLKHTLSANAHGNVNLDCLVNDKDVSGKLEREKFVEMVKPLLEQILLPVQRALDMAGVKKEDIGSVEVVGDSHRIPAISEKLNSFFGKQPSKRTNATEVVAKGAAWQCARRSPVFKVGQKQSCLFSSLLFSVLLCSLLFSLLSSLVLLLNVSQVVPYELKDLQCYPVNFSWTWARPAGAEDSVQSLVFAAQSTVPLFKQVTFKKAIEEGMSFTAAASYAEGVPLPPGTAAHLGRWTVASIPLDSKQMVPGEKAQLKIGCKLDESGVVLVSRAEKEWNEEIEYEEEQEVPLSEEELAAASAAASAAAAAAPAPAAAAAPEAPAPGATPPPAAAAAAAAPAVPAEAKQPKTKKVKVTKKKTVARSAKLEVTPHISSLSAEAVRRLQELEREQRAHDRLVVETAAERNKVRPVFVVCLVFDNCLRRWRATCTRRARSWASAGCAFLCPKSARS